MVFRVQFTTPLDLRVLPDDEWEVVNEFACKIFNTETDTEWVFVPPGFKTDLASVRRFPVMYWLFGGKARKSAVLHDWLYRETQRDRAWCDNVFLTAMRSEEPAWRRAIMWLGVRMGGWAHRGEASPVNPFPDA
jgi:hypothetical protein